MRMPGAMAWPIVEPTPIQDIFVTEFAEIEVLGSVVRYTLAAKQHIPGTMDYELTVVARLVIPIEDAMRMTVQAERATNEKQAMAS